MNDGEIDNVMDAIKDELPQRRAPQPGDIWLHFKGGLYIVFMTAKHTEAGEPLVIYGPVYGDKTWARPIKMFMSKVNHDNYPTFKQEYRFTLLGNVNYDCE